jgi:hypothetical protein
MLLEEGKGEIINSNGEVGRVAAFDATLSYNSSVDTPSCTLHRNRRAVGQLLAFEYLKLRFGGHIARTLGSYFLYFCVCFDRHGYTMRPLSSEFTKVAGAATLYMS